jgi:NAD(P)-dependent dehydrogenase (short-subunit alcohol dehydrogenase family)
MTHRPIQQLFDLKGKTALVTGGSRGLGLQMAFALGEAGAKIMLSSRKATDLEEAAAELQAKGIDARWIAADCANEADIHKLADETLQRMGDVDVLVNNAGAAWGSPAEDHPLEAWDKVMNLNVRGYFLLSQRIAKKSMIGKRAGSIINLASIAGLGLQRRGDQFHSRLGCRMGQIQHPRQRNLPRIFSQQDDDGHFEGARRRQAQRRRASWPLG